MEILGTILGGIIGILVILAIHLLLEGYRPNDIAKWWAEFKYVKLRDLPKVRYRRRRKRAKAYAKAHGYFWTPCLICGDFFGGHEWLHADNEKDGLDHTIWDGNHGEAVCPSTSCAKRANARSEDNRRRSSPAALAATVSAMKAAAVATGQPVVMVHQIQPTYTQAEVDKIVADKIAGALKRLEVAGYIQTITHGTAPRLIADKGDGYMDIADYTKTPDEIHAEFEAERQRIKEQGGFF